MQLPFLSAGQAQKEITHNEALNLIDSLLQACTANAPADTPPTSPEFGLCYLCGAEPSGAWAGHANGLACWTMGGWRFVDPFEGFVVVDRATGRSWRFALGQWSLGVINANEIQIGGLKVVGSQQPAIAGASGGAMVDVQARSVLALVLGALRSHGLIAATG
ncbi:DUF2793 domain-containing protein [Sphingomonas humi]|uniref:DUF2793 domain-containing protein n=1 Tax=Sphingomonas humi TaxID=335630 RepID=A0ABP7S1I7_9SPHN